MLNSDDNRNQVISAFPKLGGDIDFKITEDPTPDYNCFAWAANHKDVFWQPIPKEIRPYLRLDGMSFDWPFDAAEDTKLSTMISIYSKLGYEECADFAIEEGFRKIALYGTEDNITHAARQLVSGKTGENGRVNWASWFQIQHGDPHYYRG